MRSYHLILSFFLLICFSCFTVQKSYEIGIEDCKKFHQEMINELLEKAKKGLPTEPVMTSRECLKGLNLPVDLEIVTIEGNKISLDDLKGKRL